MTAVGITGPMGAGKSYILGLLQQWGYPALSCDPLAKQLMTSDEHIIQALNHLIPNAYTTDSHHQLTLNKPAIAHFLYASAANAKAVDDIVHPAVFQYVKNWLAQQEEQQLAFVESALLYQAQLDKLVSHVLIIIADESLRMQRIRQRDHLDDNQIRQRLAMQDAAWQLHLNDTNTFVIENNGEDTPLRLRNVLAQLT